MVPANSETNVILSILTEVNGPLDEDRFAF